MQKKSKKFLFLISYIFILSAIISSGCKSNKADKSLSDSTPSEGVPVVIEPNSPAQSPVVFVSPVRTVNVPTPTVIDIVRSRVLPLDQVLGLKSDLSLIALRAEDMEDLFDVTYNIMQPYNKPGMYGLDVIYPSLVIEHTSAFAKGYRTEIEVYEDFQKAVDAYDTFVAEQRGEVLDIKPIGDLSKTFSEISTDGGMYMHVYKTVALKSNVLVIITIKIEQALSNDVLQQKTGLVLNRIELE